MLHDPPPDTLTVDQVDRFVEFMRTREALRVAKESGRPHPWSDDPILNRYKFTNVRREDDRTTRWMRANWTGPNNHRPTGEIIFNCALFRYFGTVEFAEALGWMDQWRPAHVTALAQQRRSLGLRVFTGAYIIPTLGQRGSKAEAIVHGVLDPLWHERNRLASIAATTDRWEVVATELRKMPGFGGSGFMAKETLQDVIHTRALAHVTDRDSWCPAGPGARRGLHRIYGRPIKSSQPENVLIGEMTRLLEDSRTQLTPPFPKLDLHDIQFQLCEFDKYERVRLGEGRPKSKYVRRLDSTR